MKTFQTLSIICLISSVFFLPLHLNLNNIFLVSFIVLSFMSFFLKPKEICQNINQKKWLILVVALPFLLNALGLIYTDELRKGFDFTIRLIPFLCLPLIAVAQPKIFTNNYKKLGYVLLLGCLTVAFYSWSHAIIDINNKEKSWNELIGPLYSHHNLLKPLDLHSAYVSICIYTAIGFIVSQYESYSRKIQILSGFVIIILALFMFHLLSRNAIIYFLLSAVVYLIYSKKWKNLISGAIVIVIMGIGAYNIKHNYLRDRIFKSLNFFEKETQFSKKDDRFDRLAASYEIFKKKPIIGYGTAAESKHRREIFKKNNDKIAYEKNYNAHNQFFEYLSTFGLVGAITYIIFFGALFYKTLKMKNGFFIYVFTGLFLACLTESVFERSQGVVYAAICISLLLGFKKKEETDFDKGNLNV